MNNHNNVKILVIYHKKDKLFKNDILFPLHVGREIAFKKSKDGQLSKEDYDWLLSNMEGDNTGINISAKNRFLNEMTGVYWAWKNYNKIGNPDFIGLNHYRRFFKINYSNISSYLKKYDGVALKVPVFENGIKEQWSYCADVNNINFKDFDILMSTYKKLYPDDFDNFNIGMTVKNQSGLMNLFILNRQNFFEYCEWIFPILESLEQCIETNNRAIGMLAERLTSYYLWKLEKSGKKIFRARLADEPPSFSLHYFLQKLFYIKTKKRIDGTIHKKINILGLTFNIKIQRGEYNV